MHPKKLASVCALDGPRRYQYFVRKVADFQVLWGLYDEAWATASDGEGNEALPFWPEADFAEACALEEWARFHPKEIPLDAFLEKWLPGMSQDGLVVAVFPTPGNQGVFVAPERLATDVRAEAEQYE